MKKTRKRGMVARKIMPTTYFWVLMALLLGIHFIFPTRQIITVSITYFGIILISVGIVLNLWTDVLFKRKETTVKPHKLPSRLIITGPFRISRHPMYLGMALILFGLAFFLGSLPTFMFPIIFVGLMELLFIPLEEENLESTFGESYVRYKKNVRRWI